MLVNVNCPHCGKPSKHEIELDCVESTKTQKEEEIKDHKVKQIRVDGLIQEE